MHCAPGERLRRWGKRFGWLIAIWVISIAALAAIAYALRLIMSLAGMTT